MSQFDLRGKVKVIMDTQTFASGFSKREFVITTEDQYPQDVKFEVIKDKVALLDPLKPGQMINVSFNIRGNEYQGRYFVNLQAWRIQADADSGEAHAAASDEEVHLPDSVDEEEDFPF